MQKTYRTRSARDVWFLDCFDRFYNQKKMLTYVNVRIFAYLNSIQLPLKTLPNFRNLSDWKIYLGKLDKSPRTNIATLLLFKTDGLKPQKIFFRLKNFKVQTVY